MLSRLYPVLFGAMAIAAEGELETPYPAGEMETVTNLRNILLVVAVVVAIILVVVWITRKR